MSLEYSDIIEAVREAIAPDPEAERPAVVMAVQPFMAEDGNDRACHVVGVVYRDREDIEFLTIVEGENGEIYPTVENSVWLPAGKKLADINERRTA